MKPESIIQNIERAINLVKQFKDNKITVSKIELGRETYRDFSGYLSELNKETPDIYFDVVSYKGIPVERIETFDGVYIKIKLS